MNQVSVLNRHYEHVIIGGSFDALINGIHLVNSRKKTLVLDSLISNDLILEPLLTNALELEYLKKFGDLHQIESFKQISKFISKSELFIHSERFSVRLGQSSFINLFELERKSDFFNGKLLRLLNQIDPSELQSLVDKMFRKLSSGMVHYQDLENINTDVLLSYIPDFIQKIFFIFQDTLNKKQDSEYEHFLRSALCVYQKRLSRKIQNQDLLYLFLCLIGPQLQLKHSELKQFLATEYLKLGGHLKKSNIRQWSLYSNKPWAIELESFDGVIHPKSLCYLDFRSIQFPLQMKSHFSTYLSLEKKSKLKELPYFSSGTHFFSFLEDIGSQIPGCLVFNNPEKIILYFKSHESLKMNFIQTAITNYFFKLFSLWGLSFKDREAFLDNIHINRSDYLIDQTSKKLAKNQGSPILVDGSNPGGGKKLKSVRYEGLYPQSRFGRLSRFSSLFHNKMGQTSVEYILLIVAILAIIVPLLGVVKERFMASPQDCLNGSVSLSCKISKGLENFGTLDAEEGEKFRYFKLYR